MTREDRLSRRSFLKRIEIAAGGLVLSSLPIINAACKGSAPSSPDDPIEPPHDVSVKVSFYNHTQGFLGVRTYEGKSGEQFYLYVSDLGFEGVDPVRIAIRQAADIQTMGALVGFSNNGTLICKFPDNDENWEGYLMNLIDGDRELYNFVDSEVKDWGGGALMYGRDVTWSRSDFTVIGPDEPIVEVFGQMNAALANSWKTYGSFPKVEVGRIRAGYDNTISTPYGAYQGNIAVNPDLCPTYNDLLNAFLDGTYRMVIFIGKPGGKHPHEILCDRPGHLNQLGKDMFSYVYVKDAKY